MQRARSRYRSCCESRANPSIHPPLIARSTSVSEGNTATKHRYSDVSSSCHATCIRHRLLPSRSPFITTSSFVSGIWGSHCGESRRSLHCCLWNVGKRLPDYAALQPKRLPSSVSSFRSGNAHRLHVLIVLSENWRSHGGDDVDFGLQGWKALRVALYVISSKPVDKRRVLRDPSNFFVTHSTVSLL